MSESPVAAKSGEVGESVSLPVSAAKELQPVKEGKSAQFATPDAYFAQLVHMKADTFAVDKKKPLKDQPIWSDASADSHSSKAQPAHARFSCTDWLLLCNALTCRVCNRDDLIVDVFRGECARTREAEKRVAVAAVASIHLLTFCCSL